MKKQITLRIDEDVLEWFKKTGRGYQGRMNDVLLCHVASVMERIDPKYDGIMKSIMGSRNQTVVREPSVVIQDQFFKPMPKKGK